MNFRSFLTAVPGALRATGRKFAADHLSAYAAQATFYLMLAVFPFTMLVCMASRMLPFLSEETLFMLVKLLLPASYHALGTDLVDGYYNENIGSATLILVIFLIWTASRLIQALKNGFNTSCGIVESRSQIVLRLIGCLYTFALCMILVAVIVMYALGSKLMGFILAHAPGLGLLELLLKLTRNLATPVLLLCVFWFSYVFLPSRKARFREELPGAVLTTLVWRGAASLYGIFLELSFDRYSNVYGTLAGVVMILIWLYACVYVWFIGMELNCFLRECRERGMFRKLHLPLPELFRRFFRKKKHSEKA